MTLVPGMKLGPYEIVSPLGAGGMGEVWKAKDTRLDRFVAVKVLPARLSKDAELLARFEREATGGGRAEPPEHHGAPRHRHAGRRRLRGDGAAGGGEPADPPGTGAAPLAQGDRAGGPGGAGPRGGAREGGRPSRSQAGQPLGDEGRTAQDPRLRARQAAPAPGVRAELAAGDRGARHGRGGLDRARDDPRHGRLHEPGAGARRERRRAERPVLVRRGPVRDADGDARLRAGQRHRDAGGDPARRPAGARDDDGPVDSRGSRADRPPLPGEEPRPALPLGPRRRLRARERVERFRELGCLHRPLRAGEPEDLVEVGGAGGAAAARGLRRRVGRGAAQRGRPVPSGGGGGWWRRGRGHPALDRAAGRGPPDRDQPAAAGPLARRHGCSRTSASAMASASSSCATSPNASRSRWPAPKGPPRRSSHPTGSGSPSSRRAR